MKKIDKVNKKIHSLSIFEALNNLIQQYSLVVNQIAEEDEETEALNTALKTYEAYKEVNVYLQTCIQNALLKIEEEMK